MKSFGLTVLTFVYSFEDGFYINIKLLSISCNLFITERCLFKFVYSNNDIFGKSLYLHILFMRFKKRIPNEQ